MPGGGGPGNKEKELNIEEVRASKANKPVRSFPVHKVALGPIFNTDKSIGD